MVFVYVSLKGRCVAMWGHMSRNARMELMLTLLVVLAADISSDLSSY